MAVRNPSLIPALAMAAALLACADLASGQLCFVERVIGQTWEYNSGMGLASSDLNGDGSADFVYGDYSSFTSSGNISWFEYSPSEPSHVIEHLVDTLLGGATQIIPADMDGDSDVDLLITRQPSSAFVGSVVWYENEGGSPPTFRQRTVTFNYLAVLNSTAADLDRDGDTDVVLALEAGYLVWYENNGASPPVFTQRGIALPYFSQVGNLGCADLDGDSDLDIYISDQWWQNDGATPPRFKNYQFPSSHVAGANIMAADMDGDGDIDLVHHTGSVLSMSVNDGAVLPTFAPRVLDSHFNYPLAGIADLDRDGDADLLTTNGLANALTWFDNDGAPVPQFAAHSIGAFGNWAYDVAVGDFDGDLDLDVIAGPNNAHSIVWFEGVSVLNQNDGTKFPGFQPAIAAAVSGDTLVGYPGHFSLDLAPILDFSGKALDVVSRGALTRSGGTETILSGGSALRAEDGEDVLLEGSLTVPPAAVSELHGEMVTIAGDLEVGEGSGLIVGDTAVMEGFVRFNGQTIAPGVSEWLGDIHAADIDADGDVDVIASASDTILLFENDGAIMPQFAMRTLGTFPVTQAGDVGDSSLCTADVDGDGDVDLISGCRRCESISWWENDGAPHPGFSRREVGPIGHASFCAADLDGDSDVDVLSTSGTWFENSGTNPPSFLARSAFAPFIISGVAAADIDDDGDVDFVRGGFQFRFGWFENDGAVPPGFTEHTVPGPFFTWDITIVDVDKDGDLDFVTSSNDGISWFENDGSASPTFVKRNIAPGYQQGSVRAADMDADGDIDVITEDTTLEAVVWFESNGASPPAFTARLVASRIDRPRWIEVADIDGDERLDVISTELDYDVIAWHKNTSPSEISLAGGAALACEADVTVINRSIDIHSPSSFAGGGVMSLDTTSALRGDGLVAAAALHSAGLVAPDPGKALSVVGDYRQFIDIESGARATGSLVVGVDESGVLSALRISGEAALAGVLRVTAAPPFTPSIGQSFPMLSARSLAPGSRFETALFPNVGTDRFLSVVYEDAPTRTPGAHPHNFDVPETEPLPAGIASDPRVGAAVSLVVNSLSGDVELEPHPGADPGASGVPKGATLADIDLDGDPDLLIALPDAANPTTASGSVVILYNTDDGNPANGWEGFGDTLQITAGVGVNPSSVAVGRIDADTHPDIAISNRGTPGDTADDTVSILLVSNPSAQSFALSATSTMTVGDEPADVIVADLDGDGILDIATANAGSESVSIGWNAGAGTGPTFPPIISKPIDLPDEDEVPVSVRPGDTNASAFAFLATANSGTNSIGLIQINPDRTITVRPSVPAGNAPVEIVVADLNLDGEDDIAAVNRNSSSITIVLGETGLGATLAMGPPNDLPIPTITSPPRSIAAGDFDTDANGDIDLAVLADGAVKVLRNDLLNGQLAFTPVPDESAGASPLLVRSGDLNGDGRDDVVTVAESTSLATRAGARATDSVSILLAAPEPCAGDITRDGRTSASDFNALASHFLQSVTPGTNGDLTGDGRVSVADFNILASDLGCAAR